MPDALFLPCVKRIISYEKVVGERARDNILEDCRESVCVRVAPRNKKLHGNECQFAAIKFRKGTRQDFSFTLLQLAAIYMAAHRSGV